MIDYYEYIQSKKWDKKRKQRLAIDPVEGAVWRVERSNPTGAKGERKEGVDFLVRYVRPDKVDGLYLPEISGKEAVWNWIP